LTHHDEEPAQPIGASRTHPTTMSIESKLQETLSKLGLQLPPAPEPKGLYKPVIVVGNLAYTSGHLPFDASGKLVSGRVGADVSVEAGCKAAQMAALGILASLRKQLGSLDRVRRVVKIFGIVQCTPDFTQQPAVVNGCSELLAAVFGPDAGVGARSAIGASALPLGVPVEVEAIFEIV
jgi:enamine deaminase RidA (YjgF/YER057c/UK114 family)